MCRYVFRIRRVQIGDADIVEPQVADIVECQLAAQSSYQAGTCDVVDKHLHSTDDNMLVPAFFERAFIDERVNKAARFGRDLAYYRAVLENERGIRADFQRRVDVVYAGLVYYYRTADIEQLLQGFAVDVSFISGQKAVL